MAGSATTTAGSISSAAQASSAPKVDEKMPTGRLIAFFAMVVGMFMSILDIQIVSASLSEIQAGLSAGSDEIGWVQTSYLIAEVIMIPLSGTLARIVSTRYLFAFSAAGFTAASALAATASNIDQMIVYRAIQGFIGGGMIPSVFAAAFTIFPPSKRAFVSPIIGLIATLAPTIGPTVGGYLSNAFSWHWLFLVNIIPGIFVMVMLAIAIPVAVEERVGVKAALSRSSHLTRGHRWSVLGILVIVHILVLVPLFILREVFGETGVVIMAFGFGYETVATGVAAVCSGVIYHDLTVAKEGANADQVADVFD